MGKREKKIWKWTVKVHKMEWLYPYVRLEDFMEVCKWLEEENKKLKEENKQLRRRIKEHCNTQTLADYKQRFERK